MNQPSFWIVYAYIRVHDDKRFERRKITDIVFFM